MELKNICETGKPNLTKLVMTNHQLVVFIQHDPGELRGLYFSVVWVSDSEYSKSTGAKPILSPGCIYIVSPGALEFDLR
jgi:hypothetical protein